ncbi:MAG TPA: HAMP domain-containing sensor histidine kinase [Gaiellaceae bacterium]|jgi:signal transduction histidine kinase
MIREADRVTDEFVALISHELRTPLTTIIGYLELTLDDAELAEEHRRYLEIVDHSAARLLKLMDNLLLVAQIEAGALEIRAGELDLAAVARKAVNEAQACAAAKGIALTSGTDAVALVHADKGRMFQVFDNLVSNAIKFTPEGGDVRVSVAGAGGMVRLEVVDTGIGIAADDQPRLFERFFRTSTVAEQQLPGTGLGLYIVRAIVEAHGGSITVRSELGEGTSFSVALPVGFAD